jgi:phospholipase A1/A2
MFVVRPFALVLGLVFSHFAIAQTLADCRMVADNAERLACYDALAGAPADTVSTPANTANPGHPSAAPGHVVTGRDSMLSAAWELDDAQRGHILRIRPYKPVYILPYFHASRPNRQPGSPSAGHTSPVIDDLGANEAKFQISFKSKLVEDVFGDNGDFWFGYTQSSRWQVYTAGLSRPFRETNHEPEAMLVWRTDYGLAGWHGRFVSLGLNHQSNGRSLPLSRSWNRVMLSAAFERDDWTLTLRPWWRIPEGSNNDNPDISRYVGRADLHLVKRWGEQQFSVMLRHSLQSGSNSHGAVRLDYAFPIAGELRGHLQWFSGYGESLIDYNHRSNYLGLGVSLLEWY